METTAKNALRAWLSINMAMAMAPKDTLYNAAPLHNTSLRLNGLTLQERRKTTHTCCRTVAGSDRSTPTAHTHGHGVRTTTKQQTLWGLAKQQRKEVWAKHNEPSCSGGRQRSSWPCLPTQHLTYCTHTHINDGKSRRKTTRLHSRHEQTTNTQPHWAGRA